MDGRAHGFAGWSWKRLSRSPELPEPRGRQFGVAHGVLDVFVPEIGLQRTGINAVIG